MKVSTRSLYGLKALLVLASRFGEGSLSVSQIAKKEGISVAYLEQILNALKKKGLVKSVRGPQGGYVLTKKPADMRLFNLFSALEDTSFGVNGKPPASADADEIALGNFLFWKKLQVSVESGLAQVTLKDLIDEARRLKKGKPLSQTYAFHI
jgi:Rrf2 family cysteine metabolism transcriptional repressor